ncbi:MAG: ATP synthase F0 subunit A [Candidatus Staskawiczbacteria bacterium RIFOXYD2_FULL_37_9]|uniref:ATP synthase subunit a n=1 Tax=Candidatus Staskawiczbacteria bacterium RIFOXYB1_FULL_37_44 TaxID=1802223 RepID=A0A1G2IUJ7_9BACT|nr:MAG: ATP synthase F0 subunit A [Candidatus Staskawiczbacteria bacterium RIFOXYB1_FULL_37_44]OGZ84588.1 MAG: ATP synthase F0 subunit A [Candidatus Staskawiczbacteria bacterium RIFOXYC1_FULL_37_52]OGZ87634.1 MAG: ATP synthase F0 subunit A [Candidatus Staskawiczbacteria bacterium RIFOXYC2_FULL_37_19]OGZ93936.1 MAG: ATP synthase F0 subunit A [Candidatus Staskawiczbacteria bacterium RIFOXYD2_FULL_37_9]
MEEISLKAQQIFSIGSFGVTNGLFLTLIASLILIIFSLYFKSKIKMIPGKLQGAVEMGAESLLNLMESTLGSMAAAEKYFPLIATIFIFILTSNLLGILPGVGSLSFGETPLLRSPAADLNFTLAFAVISVIVTNIIGMASVGAFKHLGKYFNFKGPIDFFIGMLELISEFAKIISLSFRLFGNVFAGEVLLTIIFFLAPYFIPLPFLFLEIFVGAIQAFIFAMITLVSISLHTAANEH